MRTEDGQGPGVQISVRLPQKLLRRILISKRAGERRADTVRRLLDQAATKEIR